MSRFYSVADVANILGYSDDTIRRAIHDGELVAYKLRGGEFRIRETDLEAWLGRCRHQPQADVVETKPIAAIRTDYRW